MFIKYVAFLSLITFSSFCSFALGNSVFFCDKHKFNLDDIQLQIESTNHAYLFPFSFETKTHIWRLQGFMFKKDADSQNNKLLKDVSGLKRDSEITKTVYQNYRFGILENHLNYQTILVEKFKIPLAVGTGDSYIIDSVFQPIESSKERHAVMVYPNGENVQFYKIFALPKNDSGQLPSIEFTKKVLKHFVSSCASKRKNA